MCLSECHMPAVSLTLCQPHLEAAGRRAGGSCGALQGPSSTRSARAAGQEYCSTARCLLGRQEPGKKEGSCFPLVPQNLGVASRLQQDPHPLQPQGASLLFLPAPLQRGWLLTGGVGCLRSHCL